MNYNFMLNLRIKWWSGQLNYAASQLIISWMADTEAENKMMHVHIAM